MVKYLYKILGFLLSLFLTTLFFELFFQTSEIILPSIVKDDSTFGRSFKPNARINLIKESFYMGEINSLGYLGPSYPTYKKNNNTKRIALIGDSFVEGLQVKDKFHFRNILEHELKAKLGNTNVEVLNFGRSGLDFRRMYILYELCVKEFHPDIVLFFVNKSDFTTSDERIGPELMIGKNHHLVIDKKFANSKTFKRKIQMAFLRHFSIYNLLLSAYTSYIAGETSYMLFDKLYNLKQKNGDDTKNEDINDNFYYLNSTILKSFSNENLSVRIIIIPIASNKANRLTENYYDLIRKFNIDIVPLDAAYHYLEQNGIDPFYWPATNTKGHWNYEAHNSIGKLLSDFILVKLLRNDN